MTGKPPPLFCVFLSEIFCSQVVPVPLRYLGTVDLDLYRVQNFGLSELRQLALPSKQKQRNTTTTINLQTSKCDAATVVGRLYM